jgi:N-acetylmuramoyl-L-alanine amidase
MPPPYSVDLKQSGPLFWVQVGSYTMESSAMKVKADLESRQSDRVEVRKKDGTWKVWVGGYAERAPADELKRKLAGLGYSGFVVKSEE